MRKLKKQITRTTSVRPAMPVDGVSIGMPREQWLAQQEKARISKPRPVIGSIGILVTVAVTLALALFVQPGSARAFELLTQNNWTGGVGTDPGAHEYAAATNMNTDTPGQLKIDTTNGTYANWCNTGAGECDADWGFRQPLYLHNQGGTTLNDTIIVQKIPYNPSMNSDYSDLRFVSEDGVTPFDYVLVNATPESVLAYIKIPLINAYDSGNVFMYYGNATATSLSDRGAVFSYHDDFDLGLCGNGTISCGADTWAAVQDGEARYIIESANISAYFNTNNDRSVDRAYQLEIKFDLSNYSCDQQLNGGVGPNLNDDVIGVGTGTSQYVRCDDSGKYWSPLAGVQNPVGSHNDTADTVRIRDDQWVIVQFINLASGGTMLQYSSDGGANFTEPNYYVRDTEVFEPTSMFIGNGGSDSFDFRLKNIFGYPYDPAVRTALGGEQVAGGYTGELESAVYDLGSNNTTFGALNVATTWYSSTGNYAVYVRGGVNAPSDAIYEYCGALTGGPLSESSCIPDNARYIQYKIVMNDSSTNYLEINEVSMEYDTDEVPPTQVANLQMFDNVRNESIADGAWTNINPAISWDASTDSGLGMLGYCFYLGTDQSADLTTTAGIITASSIVDTNGACAFAASTGVSTDLDSLSHSAFNNGETYYFKISAIDVVGNVSTPTTVSFKYDAESPYIGTSFNLPPIFNSKAFTVTWLTLGALIDNHSGVAGFKYCVTNMTIGFSGCNPGDPNWYGAAHTSGNIWDTSDVVPFSDGAITMSPDDFDRIDNSGMGFAGVNMISIKAN
ncbi:DUF2341 domain-containing protein [Patescibacteria group bacterium]|nr:MAG: DUF2341 domain-containing protein [Patescibacteria group bacterium]